jgi:hypothetical protein
LIAEFKLKPGWFWAANRLYLTLICAAAAPASADHGILDPKAFTDAGITDDVVKYLTRTYKSDGTPQGSIFERRQPTRSLRTTADPGTVAMSVYKPDVISCQTCQRTLDKTRIFC